jgi:phasin family protein
MADNATPSTPPPSTPADAAKKAAEAGAKLGQKTTAAAQTVAAAGQDAARKTTETMTHFARTAAETNKALFGDVTRMFADMRFPTMLPDAGVLMAAHRRNMDVLSQANRLALEGAQAVARRHMEIMQQTMSELTEHVRELASTDTPQHKAARQAELVKQSYEHAVANIRELSDLIQRSNGEALALLNDRFKEAMDEVKGLLEKSGEKPA